MAVNHGCMGMRHDFHSIARRVLKDDKEENRFIHYQQGGWGTLVKIKRVRWHYLECLDEENKKQ